MANTTRIVKKQDFDKVCRSCLKQGPMASIFELKYENDSFLDIIFQLFSTQVTLDDQKPKNICETCITDIIRFYNFRKTFTTSEKILQSAITQELIKQIHHPIFTDIDIKEEKFDNTITICDDPEFIDTVPICDGPEFINTITIGDEDSPDDLIEIIENPHVESYELSDDESTITDQLLNLDSSDEDEIQIVCITTDNLENVEDFVPPPETETTKQNLKINGVKKKIGTPKASQPRIFTCSCQQTFTLQSEYIKHRQEEKHPRPRNHPCQICDKMFSRSGLKQHMRRHTKEKPYQCKICSSSFSLSGNLRRHMMRHTGERPHVCEFCGKGFIQGPSLTAHKRIHTGEKPFLCAYCGKSYGNSLVYRFHLQRKHGEGKDDNGDKSRNERHRCEVCSKIFSSRGVLNTHLLRHGEKNFLCSHCGKSFYSKAALLSHSRVHTGDKPFSCHICFRTFSQRGSLKTHMYTHTGDKPFVCKICEKAFAQMPHLKTHLRTHSGERPYVCSYCNKTFPHSGTLQVHVRTHTGETPYLCDGCPRGFYDSSSLKRHKRKHLEQSGTKVF